MSEAELRELAALHALDLLEGEERQRFERLLREDPRAAILLAEYCAAADAVAFDAEDRVPPQVLEDRIFTSLPEHSAPSTSSPRSEPIPFSKRSRPFAAWLSWGIAAALALVCGFLVKDRSRQSAELDQMSQLLDDYENREDLANLRIALLKSRLETAPDARAVAVWDGESQRGKLSVSDLPALPDGKEYQLWIIDPALEGPVSAGVFNTDEQGRSLYAFSGTSKVGGENVFALSVEQAGGVDSPQGPVVLLSQ